MKCNLTNIHDKLVDGLFSHRIVTNTNKLRSLSPLLVIKPLALQKPHLPPQVGGPFRSYKILMKSKKGSFTCAA